MQLVAGTVDAHDEIHNVRRYVMSDWVDVGNGVRRYSFHKALEHTGSIGFTVRVVPKHELLVTDAELGVATLPQGGL